MIVREHYNDKILDEFSKVIVGKFALNVKFGEKKMDHYLDILDAHVKVQENVLTIDQRYF